MDLRAHILSVSFNVHTHIFTPSHRTESHNMQPTCKITKSFNHLAIPRHDVDRQPDVTAKVEDNTNQAFIQVEQDSRVTSTHRQ